MLRKQWLMLSIHTKISRNIITMFGFVWNFAKNCFPFRKIISLTAFILFLLLLYFAIRHYINFKYCIGFLWLRNKVSQIWDRNSSNDPCFLLSMPLCRPCAHWICAGLMTHCNKQMHQSYYCGSSETKHEDLCFFSAYAFVRHQVRWTASLRDN